MSQFDQKLLQDCSVRMSKAIMQLMRTAQNAFVTNVILNLHREPTDKVETMALNGTTIRFNPEFIMQTDEDTLKFNLVHLAWHIVFFDELRVGSKEMEQWNQACDHYNNLMIKNDSSCGIKVPSNATCDGQYKGWDKDKIYQYILQNQPPQPQDDPMSGDLGGGQGDGEGEGEGNGDGDDQSQGQQPTVSQEQLQREMENIVQQSAMQANMAGGPVPSSVQEYLDDLYNPKLPWESILAKYMDDYSNEDYSYQKINKKFFPHGIILPTTYSEGLGEIVIANDESGSVSDEEYKTYLGAISDIHTRLSPSAIHVLNFTTRIESQHKVERDDDINKINFRGCGGTHIPCVFDHIERTGMKPQVLIIFSDMESEIPKVKPGYDVIWISVNNSRFKQPFGRCIHIEV